MKITIHSCVITEIKVLRVTSSSREHTEECVEDSLMPSGTKRTISPLRSTSLFGLKLTIFDREFTAESVATRRFTFRDDWPILCIKNNI